MKKNNFLNNQLFRQKVLWLVLFIFMALTLWGGLNHAPWRDEAQAWLIVRDLGFVEIFQQMPYEGSPPLWHLLIAPLVKSGLPYESLIFFHIFLAWALVFIWLFFSPLPKIIKIILPFNYYFLFEYAIVARNYSLSALLLFAIAALYQKRLKYSGAYSLLIFLLAWTNVFSLIPAALLSVGFIRDLIKERATQSVKLKKILNLAIMLSGIISAGLIMVPHVGQQYAGLNFLSGQITVWALAGALLPMAVAKLWVMSSPLLSWITAFSWLPLSWALIKNGVMRTAFYFSCAWLAFILMFKTMGDLRHYGLVLVFFLFFWWLSEAEGKDQKTDRPEENQILKTSSALPLALLIILMTASAIYGGYFYLNNRNKNFSGAREMSLYLKDKGLDQEAIASYPSFIGTALLPYLPDKNFYQFETQREGTFMTWDKDFVLGHMTPYIILKSRWKNYYIQNYPEYNSLLLLTMLPPGFDPELEFIGSNTRPTVKNDEFFYLYKLSIK